MKHRKYKFEDLIQDECFARWVKNPELHSDCFWRSYLEQFPEELTNLQKAKYFILSVDFPLRDYKSPTTEEIESSYDAIISSGSLKQVQFRGHKRNNLNLYLKVAATVSIIMLSSLMWYWTDNPAKENIEIHQEELVEKRAPLGQKLTVKLQDGSIVKINAGSRIVFPKAFHHSKREVLLEGEAFFEVTKDPERPFVIKSKDLITTVLGTSFVVKAYEDEPQVHVAVLTGKVLVESKRKSKTEDQGDKLYLLPNEAITYSTENNLLAKADFSYNKSFSWKDNVLYFENVSFKEVISTLSKWYGKEFEIKMDITYQNDFSAKYDDQSLEMVLEGIGFAFGFKYNITKSKVIIY